MAVRQVPDLEAYVAHLQQDPSEVDALFRDLLIGVTSFFRDPEAFKALEAKVVPRLFADRPPGAELRIWSPGCSTGEEAYGIAILLKERMEALKQIRKVQVFATDIDSHAIATARAGLYRPASPPTSAPSGWRAFSPPNRTAAATASSGSSATCWCFPSRT